MRTDIFRCLAATAIAMVILSYQQTAMPPAEANAQVVSPKPKAADKNNLAPPRQMIYATGEGAVPNSKEQPNRAKAYLEAKSYAKMQAIAGLVQLARGTMVEFTSEGKDYASETYIKQKIKGVLDSVQYVSTSKRSVGKDMIVAVTIRAPKPAPPKPTPAKAPQPAKTEAPKKQCAVGPSWLPSSDPQPNPTANNKKGYTSVVIDTHGFNLERSMSPKILRPDGSEVWGTVKTEPDFISEYGIAAYTRNRSEALASNRAGDRPLIIRAIARGTSRTGGDIVISQADAKLLEESNSETRFLDDYRVIVVIDQPKPAQQRFLARNK